MHIYIHDFMNCFYLCKMANGSSGNLSDVAFIKKTKISGTLNRLLCS